MGGNRKHGFRRGNRGGVKPSLWFCDACQKLHDGRRSRNGTLDGRSLCDRAYYRELAARDRAAQTDSAQGERMTPKLTAPQIKALRFLAGGWEAVQRRGAVYEINGTAYQLPTLHSLAKAGLAEQFVLAPGEWSPTHAFRVTPAGRALAETIGQQVQP